MSNVSDTSNSSRSSDYDTEEEQPELMGKVINKKYIGIEELGDGSYSKVWLIYYPKENNFYALKIQNHTDTKEAVKEINFFEDIGKRDCKNIINIKEKFWHQSEYGRHLCMVFPLMGETLYDFYKPYFKASSLYNFESILHIFKEVLVSIAEIHKIGIIHTDLKTENILTSKINNNLVAKIKTILSLKLNEKINSSEKKNKSGKKNSAVSKLKKIGKTIIKVLDHNPDYDIIDKCSSNSEILDSKFLLCDFGSAQYLNKIKTNKIQTRYYRCPESILDSPINDRSDIWSLGCIYYEVLTGNTLFNTKKQNNEQTKDLSDDQYHLYQMYSYFGPIPKNVIDSGKRKNKFFKDDYTFNFIDESTIKSKKLSTDFIDKFKKQNIIHLLNILVPMFRYDNQKRIDAQSLLEVL